jgi:hypothetical protein
LALSLPAKLLELSLNILEIILNDLLKPLGILLLDLIKISIKSFFEWFVELFSSNKSSSNIPIKQTIQQKPVQVVPSAPKQQFAPSKVVSNVVNENTITTSHKQTTYYGKRHREIILEENPLAEGGEAMVYKVLSQKVYKTSSRRVAKIFHDGHATSDKKKLSKLLDFDFPNYVLKPTELLYDKSGKFVGYMMCYAKGVELGELFLPNGLSNTFPKYNLIDLIDLSVTIIQAYQSIHKESIICGDISFRNILVNSKNKVYILDVDSFQMGTPSPAGLDTYTRTCNQGKSFNSYMRNIEDDSYAISMLVFQILHYGYLPYGGDDAKSIKDGICLFYPEMTSHHEVKQEIVDCYCDLSMELKVYFHEVFGLKKYRTLEQLSDYLLSYKQIIQN